LAVAAAEMCIGGRLGLDINPPLTTRDLFGETTGCLLVEVSPANIARFEETFKDLPFKKLGHVISDPVLKLNETTIPVEDLTIAFNTPI
jgi:phosphoribosylformylglycinamidine (FGAM) synthase-like enzyme